MGHYNVRNQVIELLDIAQTLVHSSPAQAVELANQAADRAQALGYGELEAQAWLTRLQAYRAQPRTTLDQIEVTALQAIDLTRAAGQTAGWVEAMNCYSDIMYGIGQYDVAMSYWLQLLEAGIDQDLPLARAYGYIGVGKLFWTFEDPTSSLQYTDKASEALQAVALINPKVCLLINQASYCYQHRDYPGAHGYLDQAEALLQDVAFCEYEPEIYYYRGYLLRAAGDLRAAQEQFKRALLLNAHSSNFWGKSVTMIGLGEVSLDLHEPHKAMYFMQQALEIASATPNSYRYIVMQAHHGLARCYQALGQTEREFRHWTLHFDLADELLNQVMNKRLAAFKRNSLQLRVHELEQLVA